MVQNLQTSNIVCSGIAPLFVPPWLRNHVGATQELDINETCFHVLKTFSPGDKDVEIVSWLSQCSSAFPHGMSWQCIVGLHSQIPEKAAPEVPPKISFDHLHHLECSKHIHNVVVSFPICVLLTQCLHLKHLGKVDFPFLRLQHLNKCRQTSASHALAVFINTYTGLQL